MYDKESVLLQYNKGTERNDNTKEKGDGGAEDEKIVNI